MYIIFQKTNLKVLQTFTYKEDAERYYEWMVAAGYASKNVELEEAPSNSVQQWKTWKVLTK